MKEIFKKYEEIGGRVSIVRFMKFAKLNCSKVNFSKLNKQYNEFEEKILKNEMLVKKDYYNFRNFVLTNN